MSNEPQTAVADATIAARKGRLGARIRVLRAAWRTLRDMKQEGLVFSSQEEAFAEVLRRFQTPNADTKALLVGIDWENIMELIVELMPVILAIIQMFFM